MIIANSPSIIPPLSDIAPPDTLIYFDRELYVVNCFYRLNTHYLRIIYSLQDSFDDGSANKTTANGLSVHWIK